jgi:hypothetical protein
MLLILSIFDVVCDFMVGWSGDFGVGSVLICCGL